MIIAIATISILAITGLIWLLNQILPFKICPICAGVSGTWLWMLGGMFLGLLPTSHFQLPTAMLMGGSVVGIAYQLEKRLPKNRSPLLWKTLFIPAGFIAVYSAVSSWWVLFAVIIILLAVLALTFTMALPEHNQKIEELEKSMKDCC